MRERDGKGLGEFQRADRVINGLSGLVLDMRADIPLSQSHMCRVAGETGGNTQEVVFTDFCPGSIIVFE